MLFKNLNLSKYFLKIFLGVRYFLMFGFVCGLTLISFVYLDKVELLEEPTWTSTNKQIFAYGFLIASIICFLFYISIILKIIHLGEINFNQEKTLFILMFSGIIIMLLLEIFGLLSLYENTWFHLNISQQFIIFGFGSMGLVSMFFGIICSSQIFLNWRKNIKKQIRAENEIKTN